MNVEATAKKDIDSPACSTGLLIGGLSGAGADTAVAGLTGNGDINIPAESLVRFRLAQDLVLQPS